MALYYGRETAPSQPQASLEGYRIPSPTGTVIAIGGHADNSTLSHVASALRGEGKILVTTLASTDRPYRFAKTQESMAGLGQEPVDLPDDELYRAVEKTATGSVLFLAGGKQDRFIQNLRPVVRDRIQQIHRLGGVFAGSSAGAAVMGDLVLTGNGYGTESWIMEEPGLGLIPGTIIDQHLTERDRVNRLRKATQDRLKTGIGLDENTGVVARNGEFEVIGVGGVYVFDRGVEQHLVRGDRYSVTDHRIISLAH